jgi:hypothetical protein
MFKIGELMFVMKSEVVGRPSVVSDNRGQSVGKQLLNFVWISTNFTHCSLGDY